MGDTALEKIVHANTKFANGWRIPFESDNFNSLKNRILFIMNKGVFPVIKFNYWNDEMLFLLGLYSD